MPNWCENTITITGDNLESIVEELKSSDRAFDFNNIVPMPEHQPDVNKPNAFWAKGGVGKKQVNLYGRQNTWYTWSVNNWGTKWNANEPQVSFDNNSIYINFFTAWSPPEPIALALSKKYPDHHIELEYEEPGMQYSGTNKYFGGKIVERVEYEW